MDININKNGGVVTFKITVIGIVAWYYEYNENRTIYRNDYKHSQSDTYDTRAIGLPHELDDHFDNWVVTIGNLSGNDETYSLRIEWIQDGKVIQTWDAGTSLTIKSTQPTITHREHANLNCV